MVWLFAVLIVLALGGVAVVASGRFGGALPPAYDDRPDVGLSEGSRSVTPLPGGPLRGEHLRRVRFPLAVRGYRMEEVDDLLARLADQLDDRPAADPEGGAEPDDRGGTAPD